MLCNLAGSGSDSDKIGLIAVGDRINAVQMGDHELAWLALGHPKQS